MQINITLNLSAPQADALEDAIKTFLPAQSWPTVTPSGHVEFAPVQLPQLRQAVSAYRQEIAPRDSSVVALGRRLEALA